jgi:hypothetical protein
MVDWLVNKWLEKMRKEVVSVWIAVGLTILHLRNWSKLQKICHSSRCPIDDYDDDDYYYYYYYKGENKVI